jgi:MFS family permease
MRRSTRADAAERTDGGIVTRARGGDALAPFRVRSFRLQWPGDLEVSWAFEMETLILGWYILVETQSVMLLTAFASLQWIGTLIAPMFGVAGDRIGHRTLLCLMRGFYTAQAAVLLAAAYAGTLTPWLVFAVSGAMSMVRPSDLAMRSALVGETVPSQHLMSAMSISRTTTDSARVVGALTGAGLIASFGMAPAYAVITLFYAGSLILTRAIPRPAAAPRAHAAAGDVTRASPWRELLEAFAYVRRTPLLFGTMLLAFLVNLTAYPLTLGLLPYVVKEVYGSDQTGLGYLAASFAFGALAGSIALTRFGAGIRAGRWMLAFAVLWYVMLLVFGFQHTLTGGIAALIVAGVAQSFSLVPMSAVLLRHSEERYRGRVLGIRMFAIYGLPLGLLAAGPLITQFGFAVMASLYCVFGIAATSAIALRWQPMLWARGAPVNRR